MWHVPEGYLGRGASLDRLSQIGFRDRSLRESEAPAEAATPWFGRSLTLPANEMVG